MGGAAVNEEIVSEEAKRKQEREKSLMETAVNFLKNMSVVEPEKKPIFDKAFGGSGEMRNLEIGLFLEQRAALNQPRGDRGLSEGMVESLIVHGMPRAANITVVAEVICRIDPAQEEFRQDLIGHMSPCDNIPMADGKLRETSSFRIAQIRITQRLLNFISGVDIGLPKDDPVWNIQFQRELPSTLRMQFKRSEELRDVLNALQAAGMTISEATRFLHKEIEDSLSETIFREKIIAVRINDKKRRDGSAKASLVIVPYGEGDCSFYFKGDEEKQSYLRLCPPPAIKILGRPLEVEDAMSRERIEQEHSRKINEREVWVRKAVADSDLEIAAITVLKVQVAVHLKPATRWNVMKMVNAEVEKLVQEALGGIKESGILSVAMQHDLATAKTPLNRNDICIWIQDIDESRPYARALEKLLSKSTRERTELVSTLSRGLLEDIVAFGDCTSTSWKPDAKELVAVAPITFTKFHTALSKALYEQGALVMPCKTKDGSRIRMKPGKANNPITPIQEWESFADIHPSEDEAVDIRSVFDPARFGLTADVMYEVLDKRLDLTLVVYEDTWHGREVYALYHPQRDPYRVKARMEVQEDK